MAIINRMSRLFTADVHAVLDRIEEPDVLLKHAVREMEEELARHEQRLRALELEERTLGERQRKCEAALAEIAEQLDVCFANGNEDLARKVIKRRLETERMTRFVGERRATIGKELAEQRLRVSERREQLDVMRQKAELLAATTAGDDWGNAEFDPWKSPQGGAVSDAEVEVALLRERQKRQPS
jgi:phage shock protein A